MKAGQQNTSVADNTYENVTVNPPLRNVHPVVTSSEYQQYHASSTDGKTAGRLSLDDDTTLVENVVYLSGTTNVN